ncbi:hydrogenase maturation protease [Mycobacterium sp. B14F4]|uniref:hydrogenase maturation protease n=1 Tax=Mycobacterium sp. B14F4 TaxID=3153565 RepID=UPI00325CEA9B
MSDRVVIGVGNSFRRDDGVGLAVVEEVAERHLPGVRVIATTGEPGALLDAWEGADLAVVVDAAMGKGSSPGQIRRWTPDENQASGAVSSHAIGIPQAFALGEALAQLPHRLVVLSVGVVDAAHGPGLTPAVAAVVPAVVDAVLAELDGRG